MLIGKPLSHEKAAQQLSAMSGQSVTFYTSLHLLDWPSGSTYTALDITRATLRMLDAQSIERYLKTDKPLDCAGSFKVESLGISLFDSISSQDPTALIGLPMIELCRGLRHLGWNVP